MSDSSSRPQLVLLVDDDLRTARRMADMLREDGFAVDVARDGAAAIARLTRSPVPDAVVTELNLADIDGATVGQFARTRRYDMPIVVVTGYPHSFRPAAFGVDQPVVFTKPVDYASLRDVLAGQLLVALPHDQSDATPSSPAHAQPSEAIATNEPGDAISGAQTVRALQRA